MCGWRCSAWVRYRSGWPVSVPVVTISILEGRDAARKQALLREVTEAVVRTLDVPRGSVRVLLQEIAPAHWAVGGVSKAEAAEG